MLRALSGTAHQVSTGVCLLWQPVDGTLRESSFVETTEVRFFELSEEQTTWSACLSPAWPARWKA